MDRTILVLVHINAQDIVSDSVNIYCLKHYTVHIKSDRNEHFVQHTGTFSELFMLVCVSVILRLFIFIVQPCHVVVMWSVVAVLYPESRYMCL